MSSIDEADYQHSENEPTSDWHECFARYEETKFGLQKSLRRYWRLPIDFQASLVEQASGEHIKALTKFVRAEGEKAETDEEFVRGIFGLLKIDDDERVAFLQELTEDTIFKGAYEIDDDTFNDIIEALSYGSRSGLLGDVINQHISFFENDINGFYSRPKLQRIDRYKKMSSVGFGFLKFTGAAVLGGLIVKKSK